MRARSFVRKREADSQTDLVEWSFFTHTMVRDRELSGRFDENQAYSHLWTMLPIKRVGKMFTQST